MKSQFPHLGLLIACVGLAIAPPAFSQNTPTEPSQQKIAVKTAADLPIHTYKIEGKASAFIQSDKPFKDFVAKLKADIESDLAKYDIKDPSTLQQFYGVLQGIAILDGKLDEAMTYSEKIRDLEQKESKKLMAGQTLRALVAAKTAGGDSATMNTAFKKTLETNVGKLPFDQVREEIASAKGRAEMLSKDLILGQIQSGIDPVVEAGNGVLSGDLARGMVNMRVMTDVLLPLQPAVAEVYGGLLAAKTVKMKDTWTPSLVTLTEKDAGTPVIIAIWDSGVDASLFPHNLYVNTKEVVNGKDDDNNGFIDDVNGIAFDLQSHKVPALLHSIKELKSPLALVENNTKGMADLQSNIDSPEAGALKKYISGLKADQVEPFLEDLGLFGNYSHGTHVAGIASEGNPFSRLLVARITFDYKAIPTEAPNEELSKATAKAAQECVDYFKQSGVRVVNMSWGGSYKDIEESLEKKGIGKTPQDRSELAKKLFAIEKNGLETAIKSAPDILFIAAAGNSNNDNAFEQFIPSGLTLANMITVGAVDSSGKPTGFTTFGSNVRLYANGFEVESYVPGGKRMKYSGTSMAAPNAANLAAKLIALNPSLSPKQTIELMVKGALPMEGHSELLVINPKNSLGLLSKK